MAWMDTGVDRSVPDMAVGQGSRLSEGNLWPMYLMICVYEGTAKFRYILVGLSCNCIVALYST